MKKSKILSSLIALTIAVSLVGCGSSANSTNNATKDAPKTEETTKAPEKTDVVAEVANGYFANMPDDNYKISEKTFVEQVKAEEDMFILDIRQADVYAEGHIKGAVNAPWGTAISDNLDKLPKDKTIMVYCYTGQTAGQTVALLNMAGFNARSVNLGWNLGISKVDGVEDVTETTLNDFADVESIEIKPEIKTAIVDYFNGLATVKDTDFANYKISEENAKKLIDAKDDSIVVLSVRSAEDFAKGHIDGATNIAWGKGMQENFSTLPTDKKIIVYCYTGQTAGQTVAGLKMLGYDAVSLNGGMGTDSNAPSGWANNEFPVVK
ncbi:rhodanese-like domain-containing protein [Clostridium sp.]|uniref:rhodanese-like domain-containing protein n=1 Tax=Clostridium sp. TaxID=1506 RepID=UPI001A4A4603|nr:rhodanese-like domain-containing protein [Clostridium sp.]MBK5241970.1 rhodanese-like domain-containing protein [Clostridium sp.]